MNINQKGFMQWLVIVIVLVGLVVGVYLVQQRTNLKPKASEYVPVNTYQSTQDASIQDDSDLMKELDDLESVNVDADDDVLTQNDADLDSF